MLHGFHHETLEHPNAHVCPDVTNLHYDGLFGFILLLLALAFAISNRQSATISLWPFDAQVEAPLYLLTLGLLLIGLLLGAGFAWLSMLPHWLAAPYILECTDFVTMLSERMVRAVNVNQRLLARPRQRTSMT